MMPKFEACSSTCLPQSIYEFLLAPGGQDAGEPGSSSRFWEKSPGRVWRLVAEAGGGFGAGKLHGSLLFSPGGQGGFAWSNSSQVQKLHGMNGQSSRSDLEVSAAIPIIDSIAYRKILEQSIDANYSYRIPCTGIYPSVNGGSCFHEPDFFLTCSTAKSCVGAASWVDQYVYQIAFNPNIFILGQPQGGSAPHGVGGVKRGAGKGGRGQCVRVENGGYTHSSQQNTYPAAVPVYGYNRYQQGQPELHVRAVPGSNGSKGLASIRACRRLQSEETTVLW